MTDSIDSATDVVSGCGEVHVGQSVALSSTGHVTSRSRPHGLLPGEAGLGHAAGLAPEADGVALPGRHLAAPGHRGDAGGD